MECGQTLAAAHSLRCRQERPKPNNEGDPWWAISPIVRRSWCAKTTVLFTELLGNERKGNMSTKAYADFRQEITNDVIKMIEDRTAPWLQPWSTGEIRAAFNPTTGQPYRGGNVIALMVTSLRKGYTDSRWCTYRQAAEHGWQVRKGEKSSRIEFFKEQEEKDEETGETKFRPVARHYPVFNAQQIDGIPKIQILKKEDWEAIKAGERILAKSGAVIKYDGDSAYYSPTFDYIHLPKKEHFFNAACFYSTACHELAHWTGHSSRLNRLSCMMERGSEEYAREELVAELTSWFVSAETGLPFDPSQHAAYIKSWLRALKKDKNEIFRAAAHASRAADYLLQVSRKSRSKKLEAVAVVTLSAAA
jgi:antirestriction protein ArdC